MLVPLLGGALDAAFGWRASFVAFVAFGAAVLALCWVDLGETNRSRSETFAAQLRSYPELFRSRRFWGYSLCMAFSIGAFYIFLGGAPLVAAAQIEMSPVALGAAMGSTTAGFVLGRDRKHTSALQSLMRSTYAVFCLKTKNSTQLILK